MAKKKENKANLVRINLRNEESFANYQRLETALIVKGRDVSEFWSEIIKNALNQYGIDVKRRMVSGDTLRGIGRENYTARN